MANETHQSASMSLDGLPVSPTAFGVLMNLRHKRRSLGALPAPKPRAVDVEIPEEEQIADEWDKVLTKIDRRRSELLTEPARQASLIIFTPQQAGEESFVDSVARLMVKFDRDCVDVRERQRTSLGETLSLLGPGTILARYTKHLSAGKFFPGLNLQLTIE